MTEQSHNAAPLVVHVLGHPDLPLDVSAAPANAQVLNCRQFCLLLARAGVPFTYYGISGSRVPGGEFADLGTSPRPWKYGTARHREYNEQANRELGRRLEAQADRRHLICSLYGAAQAEIDPRGFPVIEPMLGYDHCWAPYRVFPSYAHQQVLYTLQEEDVRDTRWFDTVIPHFLVPDEYPLGSGAGDYALYLGRNAEDKGVAIAEELCLAAGMPLKKVHDGVWGEEKATLVGRAKVVLMPTLYLEPFGYVAIEAQMCGVPVLTTDWGAFAETVEQGRSGFRCRTRAEFLLGLRRVGNLDREAIRARAVSLYGIDAATPKYLDYFDFVWNVHKNGGYYAPDAVRCGRRVKSFAKTDS
jgi:glycosyltransferase involved in cell wall biosynthesis